MSSQSSPIVLSICSAVEIHNLVFGSCRKRIESSDVFSLSIPLECLFGCPMVRDYPESGPRRLFENYFHPGGPGDDDRINAPASEHEPFNGYEESTPNIINHLFELREINANNEGVLREYRSMYAGSNGLVITRIEEC
jgi:hypothetical protein